MRGLRSTAVLLVALIGLSTYIYFVTWKKTDSDTASKLEKVFAGLSAEAIDEITVTSESGDTTAVKKVNGTWQLQAPHSGKADEANVSGMTSGLAALEISRVIEENPADVKDYGLGPARIQVSFTARGDKSARTLSIGEKSPTGAQLFARRNDEKRVFLIPAFQDATYNRSTFDLRDKSLLTFEREKVDGLEVTADGKTLQLGKDGPDWKIVKPLSTKADYGSVEGLIGRLQMAQMKALVANDAPPADLKRFGLDKPAISANVNAGSSRATLLVGSKTPDGTFYAKDMAKTAIFTIEGTLADDLKKGADEYRRKDLFELRPYNTNRIEITRDGQTVVFEMTKGTGAVPNTWRRVSPNPGSVDAGKADAFLTKLSNLRALSFLATTAKTGLDKPAVSVHAKFEDTKEDRVAFGKAGSDVYAAPAGEAGAAKVDSKDFDAMLAALDEVAK